MPWPTSIRGDLPDAVCAHHDDFGAGCPGHLRPINGGLLLGRVLVSRDQGQPRAKRPVRERHARITGHRHERGNPGHNLKRDARVGQLLGFLAASAKNIRVAPFEPDHRVAGARLGNEQFIEFLWAIAWSRPRLPPKMISADFGASRSNSGFTSASWTTTSARASNSAPRTVSNPASPGPAPTR